MPVTARTTNPQAAKRPVRPFDVVLAEIAEGLAECKQLVCEISSGLDRAGVAARKTVKA